MCLRGFFFGILITENVNMTPQGRFSRKETKACLIIWISAVLYSCCQFFVANQKYFREYHDHYDDFTIGWSILSFRRRDKADFEWETVRFIFTTVYPVMLLYSLLCEGGRRFSIDIKLQQHCRLLFSVLYLSYFLGYRITLTTLLQPVLFYLAALLNGKWFIWICNLICLALITLYKKASTSEEFLEHFQLNHFEAYANILLLCWMNLKCTSFFLNMSQVKHSLLDYGCYCFYFPTLFTGPFIGFEDFQKLSDVKNFPSTLMRVKKLMLDIMRCIFWMIFADFWLHFVYINATSFQLELLEKFNMCSLCGYGYLMGQFFHIKYVVLYGLCTSLASFECVAVPSLPRCIGRVHLYSDMWKYFDPGLYNFLKTSIYIPALKLGLKRLGASLLCFLFVFVWHGIEEYILIWAALNFIGIVLENLANSFYIAKLKDTKFIKKIQGNILRRLKSLLGAPLLAMSAVSNFYFFAGKDVGNIFVRKSLNEPYVNLFLLLMVLYCCCETSTELRNVNAKTM